MASTLSRYLAHEELPATFRFLSIQHRSDAIRGSPLQFMQFSGFVGVGVGSVG